MNKPNQNLSVVRRECIEFAGNCNRVQLAAEGDFEVHNSPFVQFNDEFYLYLRESSIKSENMIDSGQANLMFIEDELSSPHAFARRQLTYQCEVNAVSKGYQYTRIMVAFQDRLGALMDTLRRVPNCQLLRLTPSTGKYINSLAQAFTFEGYRAHFLNQASRDSETDPFILRKSK